MTSRAYCFTLNNPEFQLDFDDWPDMVRYAVWQLEMGSNGTPHYQGYVELATPVRFSALKNNIAGLDRAHIEKRFGSRDQARDYCMKQDETYLEGPWEYGNWNNAGQGNRTDVYEIQKIIKEGRYHEVPERNFHLWCQYRNSFDAYNNMCKEQVKAAYEIEKFAHERLDLSKPVLLTGPSGIGKTQFALAHFRFPLLVKEIDDLKLLTRAHDGIVFDDMSFNHWPAESVIHLLDFDTPSSIHCRNTNATIPAKMSRIFTHNESTIFMPERRSFQQERAILRRFVHVRVEKLFNDPINVSNVN